MWLTNPSSVGFNFCCDLLVVYSTTGKLELIAVIPNSCTSWTPKFVSMPGDPPFDVKCTGCEEEQNASCTRTFLLYGTHSVCLLNIMTQMFFFGLKLQPVGRWTFALLRFPSHRNFSSLTLISCCDCKGSHLALWIPVYAPSPELLYHPDTPTVKSSASPLLCWKYTAKPYWSLIKEALNLGWAEDPQASELINVLIVIIFVLCTGGT